MIVELPYKAPKGYSYEFEQFNSKYIQINLKHHAKYDYNLGKPVSTIYGFFNIKTKEYHSPVNAKTVGKSIKPSDFTAYTMMKKPSLTPLEQAFL